MGPAPPPAAPKGNLISVRDSLEREPKSRVWSEPRRQPVPTTRREHVRYVARALPHESISPWVRLLQRVSLVAGDQVAA